MSIPGSVGPFRSANYSIYFTGQVASHTGTWFQNLAISLVILEATGSARTMSLATVAQFGPIFAFSLLAGKAADTISPRRIVLVTSAFSATVVGGLAVVLSAQQSRLPPILLFLALLGSASAFERVASQALIFELVGQRELSRAVALSTVAQAVARSIGPGLAGIAFEVFGPVWCMVINSASFLVVTASMLAIRREALHERPKVELGASVLPQGRFFNRDVKTLLAASVLVAVFGLSLMVVITAIPTVDFGAPPSIVGMAHGLNALGAVLGGLIAAQISHRSVRAVIGATLLFSLTYFLSAASPALLFFLIVSPLLGVGISYYQATLYSVAQSIVPPHLIGRMVSLMTLGQFGSVPVAALLAGAVVDAFSGRAALAMGGVAGLLAALFIRVRTRDV